MKLTDLMRDRLVFAVISLQSCMFLYRFDDKTNKFVKKSALHEPHKKL